MEKKREKLIAKIMIPLAPSLKATLVTLAHQNERSLAAEVRVAIKSHLRERNLPYTVESEQ